MNDQIEILDDAALDGVAGGLSLSFSFSDGISFESSLVNIDANPISFATGIFDRVSTLGDNLVSYLQGVGGSLLDVGGIFDFS